MKCEKHGFEMKWVGSLTKGSMSCPGCVSEVAEMQETKCGDPYDYNRDKDALAKQYVPNAQILSAPAPQPSSIDWAKVRSQAIIDGLDGLWNGKISSFCCPYCHVFVNKGEEYTHYATGTPCTMAWQKDKADERP